MSMLFWGRRHKNRLTFAKGLHMSSPKKRKKCVILHNILYRKIPYPEFVLCMKSVVTILLHFFLRSMPSRAYRARGTKTMIFDVTLRKWKQKNEEWKKFGNFYIERDCRIDTAQPLGDREEQESVRTPRKKRKDNMGLCKKKLKSCQGQSAIHNKPGTLLTAPSIKYFSLKGKFSMLINSLLFYLFSGLRKNFTIRFTNTAGQ